MEEHRFIAMNVAKRVRKVEPDGEGRNRMREWLRRHSESMREPSVAMSVVAEMRFVALC